MSKNDFSVPIPKLSAHEDAAMPYHPGTESPVASKAQRDKRASLMAIEGVEGVGTGQDAIGNEAIMVYVRDQDVAKQIPPTIEGMKVVVQVTGPIDALKL